MKIKKFLYLCLWGACCSCSKDEIRTVDFFEPLAVDTIFYGFTNGEQSVALEAGGQVTVEMPEEERLWCQAEITNTTGGQILTVRCADYTKAASRYALLTLKYAEIVRKLVVCQYGTEPLIKVIKANYELSADSVLLKVPVIATVDYIVEPAEKWIYYHGMIKGESVDTLKLAVGASAYPRRSGEVVLKGEKITAMLSITQVNSDTLYHPENGSLPGGKIKIKEGTTNYEALSEAYYFDKSFDDSYETAYCSKNIPLDNKLEMVWHFEKPEALVKLSYTPYMSGTTNQMLGKFNLLVREEGGSGFVELGEFDFQYRKTSSYLELALSDKKIEAVKMVVSRPPNATRNWSLGCQEIEFRAKGFDIMSIFTDEICSDLKKGVTYEQILGIEDEFYRDLARYMYMGTYEKEFRIQEYAPYINPDVQKSEHKSFAWSFLDNATGIYVEAGDKIVLLVDEIYNEDIRFTIVDWNTATYKNINPQIPSFPLRKGVNEYTANTSGLIYVLYNPDDRTGKKGIKIHIASGKVNGYFDVARHDNAYWKSLLNKADFKFLDVKGTLAHLVFPTADFRTYCPDNVERLVQVYDSIILLEHQQCGLYKYDRMYPNRMLCKVTYEENAYMYAYNYQMAFRNTTVNIVLDAQKLRQDMWGTAHEMGHVHQNRDINWRGMTEVSNNVFSLYVQRKFGWESRMLAENHYQQAYDLIAIPGAPHGIPGTDSPFAKVVPLWQMFLYFTEIAGQPYFNMDLYEEMRNEQTPACPQLNFVELCCRISKVDLTDFFAFFGFLTPIDDDVKDSVNPGRLTIKQSDIDRTKSNIVQMGLQKKAPAIQYLTEKNMEMFRMMKVIETGTVKLTGAQMNLSGWKNVVAWEVYLEENGGEKLIQISLNDNFTLKQTGSSVRVKAVAADGKKVNVNL